MKQTTDPTQEPKPENLLHGFSQTRLGFWIIVAFVVHLALVAGTSVPYLYDTWIDPEGAEERRAATEEDEEGEEAEAVREAIEEGAEGREEETPEEVEEPVEEPTEEAAGEPEEEQTPVERRVEEAAEPDEIPRDPDDLGISLEETNR